MIDTSFNFQSDTPVGLDPDKFSPTLHRYHQALWGRPLPNGRPFHLEDVRRKGGYLRHRTDDGREFWLSSDAAIPTYTRFKRLPVKKVVEQADEEDRRNFYALAYTIGAMMLFPGKRVERLPTINQERGLKASILDWFDLTVECIRRHYVGLDSPLGDVLQRYAEFFELFAAFDGYVEHFLLQDMLTADGTVRFFLPCEDFRRSPLPRDIGEYDEFRKRSMQFIRARNERVDRLSVALAS